MEQHVVDEQPAAAPSRRTVMLAGAGTAAGLAALTACGSSSTPAASAPTSAGGGSSAAGGGPLVKLSAVPVGGAVSAKDAQGRSVIVSQPKAGEVVAFSAICTHMGCTVAPADGIIQCPCHGSTYDLATGKNTGGPAPRPLARIDVKVTGGDVVET